MSNLSTIKGNFATEMDAIVTAGDLSSAAFGRAWGGAGYPYARYYYNGTPENEQVTAAGGAAADYWVTHSFAIEVIQSIPDKGAEEAEIAFMNACDAVRIRFENNWDLGDANDLVSAPFTESVEDVQTSEGRSVIAKLIVNIKTVVSYT
tara:strand:+ start:620 stop:1066 length:447 start_codon:yes stop_codon:yes gene_type:complete